MVLLPSWLVSWWTAIPLALLLFWAAQELHELMDYRDRKRGGR